MKYGLYLRNSGPLATRDVLIECARIAESAPIDDLWVFDHLAISREESEGSGGLYVEPLATLAFVAGATERIGLGTGILVLPYRPALLMAKWAASLQTLSGGRLRLGVGVGWMKSEFQALGVNHSRRGALTDEALELLHRCFANDEVEVNGQRFLFLPRPGRPPIYVGGAGDHAIQRAVKFGDGWMPGGMEPDKLEGPIARLRVLALEAGRPVPEVVALGSLPLDNPARARSQVEALAAVGVTRLAINYKYATVDEFRRVADVVAQFPK